MTPTFTGQVNDGRLLLDKSPQFKDYLQTLNGKRIELTVEKLKHPRTNSQNRYYHGVVVKTIAQHTGHDPEQIHELLKQQFAGRWVLFGKSATDGHTKEFYSPNSTATMDTISFTEYTEKCRLWATEFLGLQIPLPGEVTAYGV